MSEWARVSKHRPCPVCGGSTWCTFSTDGTVTRCTRVQSESPSVGKDGSPGWTHFDKPLEIIHAPQKPREVVDAAPIARKCYEEGKKSDAKSWLAEELGVSEESLDLLRVGVGEDHDGTQWYSFPSKDGDGNVIGITRRYIDGSKKTYAGTSNGIFCTYEWWKTPGIILIVEGASDVAAAHSAGICAIGRSSNLGGVAYIQKQLEKHAPGRKILVIGERDEKPEKRGKFDFCAKDCAGCSYCYPGKYGAEMVSQQLKCNWCMPLEPHKDLRQMFSGKSLWADALRCLT